MDWRKTLRDAQAAAKAARELATKAEGRNFTTTERKTFEDLTEKATRLKADADSQRKLAELAADDGNAPGDPYDGRTDRAGRNGKSVPGSPWAREVADRLSKGANGIGVKAILQGEVDVPPVFVGTTAEGDIANLPAAPNSILSLIAADVGDGLPTVGEGNTYSYLRQVTRDEDVQVVADGATKPTSSYVWEEIEDRHRVIAHLSEPFPLRYLNDFRSLTSVLDDQMRAGVLRELENQLVNGDGEGENFPGIFATTGVTDVAFATDSLTTVRKARTALDVLGEIPTGWVVNPTDAETFDLMREDGATGGFLMDSQAADNIFGAGTRRVMSLAVPQGTALLGDWRTIEVKVREGAHTLAATQAGDLFDKNQVKLRAEGRFGVKIRRPQAIAVVHLEAA